MAGLGRVGGSGGQEEDWGVTVHFLACDFLWQLTHSEMEFTHLQNGQGTGKPDLKFPRIGDSQVSGLYCTVRTTQCAFVSFFL